MSTNAPLDPRRQAARSDDGTNDQLLTTAEAAAYLRVSKSYLDKLRVYGGGPKFVRPGKRKIIYRKPHLDVWAAERTFTSTSEYDDPAKDQSDCMSNNKKEHPALAGNNTVIRKLARRIGG